VRIRLQALSTLAVGGGLGLISPVARRAALLELGLYATATLAAAARYKDRRRPSSALRLALIYPILHVAYGLGMVAGLMRLGAVAFRANT